MRMLPDAKTIGQPKLLSVDENAALLRQASRRPTWPSKIVAVTVNTLRPQRGNHQCTVAKVVGIYSHLFESLLITALNASSITRLKKSRCLSATIKLS